MQRSSSNYTKPMGSLWELERWSNRTEPIRCNSLNLEALPVNIQSPESKDFTEVTGTDLQHLSNDIFIMCNVKYF